MIPTGTNLEVKKTPVVTICLVLVNAAVFACEPLLQRLLGDNIRFLMYGTGSPYPVGLFTSLFLHADLFHIVFNMLFLWVFGPPLEDRVGRKLFLVYYIGAGVAASVFELLVDFIHDPARLIYGIGASGAVSGIMGIYLYRCYHSKMKMVVSPLFLPVNIQIPAAPLLILWLLQDAIHGYAAFSQPTGIAHWAHVGGFLFGLAVGRIKKYGHEGAVEHYTAKVLEKIRSGGGWKGAGAERELLKLLKMSPNDPDIQLELGHYYRENGRHVEAIGYYQTAISRFLLTNPLVAGYTMLDYVDSFGKTVSPQHHLKAAEALVQNGDIEEAFRLIAPVLAVTEPRMIAERVRVMHIKLCKALGKAELDQALEQFRTQYSASRYRQELDQALGKQPGQIFPAKPAPAAPQAAKAPEPEAGERESKTMYVLHRLINLIVDPVFLFLWFVMLFVVFAVLPKGLLVVQVVSFAVAYVFAAMYRIDWSDMIRDLTVDEEAARLAADTATRYNQALLAEKGENFPKAAELYEKVLAHDTTNLQARFNLARIYTEKLNDRMSGSRHLRMLLKEAPEGHPYHEYAKEGIGRRPGTSR